MARFWFATVETYKRDLQKRAACRQTSPTKETNNLAMARFWFATVETYKRDLQKRAACRQTSPTKETNNLAMARFWFATVVEISTFATPLDTTNSLCMYV